GHVGAETRACRTHRCLLTRSYLPMRPRPMASRPQLPDMLLALCVPLPGGDSATYSGRDRQLDVPIPRFEADVVIDGGLSDSVWAHAARLTGFSQYSPNDDVPAADSTQVLVWYSAAAIYFGIRAFEQHGRPTMTLANRDQIFGDDNVQILLGTFHDGKQALMFAVNPLGVQGDGT